LSSRPPNDSEPLLLGSVPESGTRDVGVRFVAGAPENDVSHPVPQGERDEPSKPLEGRLLAVTATVADGILYMRSRPGDDFPSPMRETIVIDGCHGRV
jgi:hypothetical protein